jgi:hypothetical protein
MLCRNTIDFAPLSRDLAPTQEHKMWYVLLLIDQSKGGHTNIIKSTNPEFYLRQRKPGQPRAQTTSTNWRLGQVVEIGPHEHEAVQFVNLVSVDPQGKQIRGIFHRAANVDVVATKFAKPSWAEFSLIFDVPNVQAFLQQNGYVLTEALE